MSRKFFREEEFPWQTNPTYPNELRRKYRYRLLVDDPYMSMGILELDVGAVYPAHCHTAPEVYFLLEGKARWRIGGEESEISAGALMHHAPADIHEFENIGDVPLKLIWIWWAKDGQTEVLRSLAVLVNCIELAVQAN